MISDLVWPIAVVVGVLVAVGSFVFFHNRRLKKLSILKAEGEAHDEHHEAQDRMDTVPTVIPADVRDEARRRIREARRPR